jgi:hypothetical protein
MPDDEPAADDPPSVKNPTQLWGGINFSTWADLKWSRANTHIAAMQSKFGEWHASAPVSVEAVLREDRQGIDLVARVPRGIPKHEWSLDLGDALHNFRSAFDAVAWGMAHFEDSAPARPKSVTFPICEDEKRWKESVKAWIGDIRPEFQERIRIMQPFTYAAGGVTVLSMLHELDIQDKHRDILTVSADLQAVNLSGSFEYLDRDTQNLPQVEMHPDVKFADGAILGTIHAGGPIRLVGEMFLRPKMKVQLNYQNQTYDVLPMLQQFTVETRRCIDILLFGLAAPNESEGAEWLPMDVGQSTT